MNLSHEEISFLKQIESDLGDDSSRLVYADWLEERGDVRAEYLRLDVQITSDDDSTADTPDSITRIEELTETIDPDWLAVVSRSPIEGCHSHLIQNRGCPQIWRALHKTDTPTIRVCETCKSPVHFCTKTSNAKWFYNQASAKIVVESSLKREVNDLQEQDFVFVSEQEEEDGRDESLTDRAINGEAIARAAFPESNEQRSRLNWRRNC